MLLSLFLGLTFVTGYQTIADLYEDEDDSDDEELTEILSAMGVESSNEMDPSAYDRLHMACAQGRLREIRAMTSIHGFRATATLNGQTPLMVASHMGFVEVVQLLLAHDAGSNINTGDTTNGRGLNSLTALHYAIDGYFVKEAGVPALFPVWETPNVDGLAIDHKAIISALLDAGAEPIGKLGNGPLCVSKLLSTRNCFVSRSTHNDEIKIESRAFAVELRLVDVTEALLAAASCEQIEAGLDEWRDLENMPLGLLGDAPSMTPLQSAARSSHWHAQVCRNLFRDFHEETDRNTTMFHFINVAGAPTIREGHCIQSEVWPSILVKSGQLIDVLTRDMYGRCEIEIDFAEPDASGTPPLPRAAMNGDLDSVTIMLERGADFGVKTLMGVSALHYAAIDGHDLVVRRLVEAAAVYNEIEWAATVEDGYGRTADKVAINNRSKCYIQQARRYTKDKASKRKHEEIQAKQYRTSDNDDDDDEGFVDKQQWGENEVNAFLRMLNKCEAKKYDKRHTWATKTADGTSTGRKLYSSWKRTKKTMLVDHPEGIAYPATSPSEGNTLQHSASSSFGEAMAGSQPAGSVPVMITPDKSNSGVRPGELGWNEYIERPPLMGTRRDEECDFEVVDLPSVKDGTSTSDLSVEYFVKQHMSRNNPAIFRGAARHWPAFKRWTSEHLTAVGGAVEVATGKIPYSDQEGVSGGNVALGKFIADMKNITGSVYGRAPDGGPEEPPMYVFDRKILLGTDFGGLVMPSWVEHEQLRLNSQQFILGPEGSGAPVHFHGGAFNAALAGRKRWFLYTPDVRFWSTKPALQFYREDYIEGEMLECTQLPGDIVFVPGGYGHGVLNVEDTLGVAIEFSLPDFLPPRESYNK